MIQSSTRAMISSTMLSAWRASANKKKAAAIQDDFFNMAMVFPYEAFRYCPSSNRGGGLAGGGYIRENGVGAYSFRGNAQAAAEGLNQSIAAAFDAGQRGHGAQFGSEIVACQARSRNAHRTGNHQPVQRPFRHQISIDGAALHRAAAGQPTAEGGQ